MPCMVFFIEESDSNVIWATQAVSLPPIVTNSLLICVVDWEGQWVGVNLWGFFYSRTGLKGPDHEGLL